MQVVTMQVMKVNKIRFDSCKLLYQFQSGIFRSKTVPVEQSGFNPMQFLIPLIPNFNNLRCTWSLRKTCSNKTLMPIFQSVSYTHLRAHETRHDLVCRLLLEKKKKNTNKKNLNY